MKHILGRLVCDYLTWWRTVKSGLPISGHAYVEVERSVFTQVLACSRCGDRSKAYYGAGR